jgi:hypothetical protein
MSEAVVVQWMLKDPRCIEGLQPTRTSVLQLQQEHPNQ